MQLRKELPRQILFKDSMRCATQYIVDIKIFLSYYLTNNIHGQMIYLSD